MKLQTTFCQDCGEAMTALQKAIYARNRNEHQIRLLQPISKVAGLLTLRYGALHRIDSPAFTALLA